MANPFRGMSAGETLLTLFGGGDIIRQNDELRQRRRIEELLGQFTDSSAGPGVGGINWNTERMGGTGETVDAQTGARGFDPMMQTQSPRTAALKELFAPQLAEMEFNKKFGPPPAPVKLGANESMFDPVSGKRMFGNEPPPPGPSSPLGRMIADMNALPPDSPLRGWYKSAIEKETTRDNGQNPETWEIMTPEEVAAAGLPDTGRFERSSRGQTRAFIQPKQEKPTEGEAKYGFNARRLASSAKVMQDVIAKDPTAISSLWANDTLAGRTMNSDQTQRFKNAMANAVDAIITLGTGASYTPEQLAAARQSVMPQVGDKDEALSDKFDLYQAYAEAAKEAAREAGRDIDIPDLTAAWRQAKAAPKAERPKDAPPNARQAPNGKWYSPDPRRPGKYIEW